jgi:ankyrin repeat protein
MGEAKRRKQAGNYPAKERVRQESGNTAYSKCRLAFEAAEKGDLETLKSLVRTRREANWQHPEFDIVLLDQAVMRNDIEMLRFLLEQGANPNALFECGRLVLCPSDFGDGMYFSPLATAISDGHAEILVALLDAGADLNLPKWIDNESGERMTCRDALDDSPELFAAMEALILKKVTSKACSPSRAQRI